jgi:hypothetical protein
MSDLDETDAVFLPAPRTLEDYLLTLREQCSLVADFFMLHAQALEGGARVELSTEGCYGLSELCEQSADVLRRLGKVMPGEVANWMPPVDGPRPGGCRRLPDEHAGPIRI